MKLREKSPVNCGVKIKSGAEGTINRRIWKVERIDNGNEFQLSSLTLK
ncbi:hypothetical protein D1BOALGB6SA_10678 [Olavius sp. associated proteobacterium Delta 1]|nr:hypothetical protein D1BOALGB6SA_10678 [Olavius sp. associated proteobacterium Delta 1]